MKRIQIIGTQRSGSNLLRVMLHQHPNICAPHPPHLLKTFYPLLQSYGDLGNEANFYRLVGDMVEWVKLNPVVWENFEPSVPDIVKLCNQPTIFQILKAIYDWEATSNGRGSWVCKSMSNYEFVNDFENERIFDHYIFLYRDGRDVALSFAKAIVGPKTTYHCARQWAEDQRACLKIVESLGDKLVTLRYEDLIDRPVEVMDMLFRALGMEAPANLLQYPESSESVHAAQAGDMWKNLSKPVLPGNKLKYVTEMSAADQMVFESIAGDTLHQLGYQVSYWPDQVRSFSADDLARIDINEAALKRQARLRASARDLKLREGQDEFLRRLVQAQPSYK